MLPNRQDYNPFPKWSIIVLLATSGPFFLYFEHIGRDGGAFFSASLIGITSLLIISSRNDFHKLRSVIFILIVSLVSVSLFIFIPMPDKIKSGLYFILPSILYYSVIILIYSKLIKDSDG